MARLVWLRSARRRRRDLRRPLEPLERLGRQRLPGTSVDTELYEARDAYDRPFALLLAPATGHASLVLSLVPPADDLLDAEGAELWIADLGVWLAMLVHEPHLAGCAVSLLHDPHAGPAAGLVVTLQLTWRTRGPQGRTDAAALAVELGARLPHLVNGLRRCEAGTAAPLTAAEVARIVGSAYDPLGQGRPGPGPSGPGAAGTEALRVWPDAGPGEASEGWDRLRHDSATSLTWSLSEVRPDLVLSGVLAQLAAAHAEGRPEAARTRVTLLHRPAVGEPSGAADPESEWTGLPAHVLAPQADSDPYAEPPDLTSLVTVSVTGRSADLDQAVQGVLTGVSPSLRPWMRPLYGTQAAAFAAAIPSGTLLGVHTAAPTIVRESDA